MTGTAKRRWSRELDSQVDGIAFSSDGPVLLHGYDPPAGGKWIDDVIPGKLGAFDRNTGERLWLAPCEVGYGRGFGAGIGQQGQVIVLGPSLGGHRMVRMALADGELLDAAPIEPFDEALVTSEIVVCTSPKRIWGIDTLTLQETWEYAREGERYHHVSRLDDTIYAVLSVPRTGKFGVAKLDAATGKFLGFLVTPSIPLIRGLVGTTGAIVLLTSELEFLLPREDVPDFLQALAAHPDGGPRDTLTLVGLSARAEPGERPLWFKILETTRLDDLPDVSISADSGKVYIERRAHLEALDAMSGRHLGEWTVPGLDEQISWSVVDGAGLLAEETRVSVFELPA